MITHKSVDRCLGFWLLSHT